DRKRFSSSDLDLSNQISTYLNCTDNLPVYGALLEGPIRIAKVLLGPQKYDGFEDVTVVDVLVDFHPLFHENKGVLRLTQFPEQTITGARLASFDDGLIVGFSSVKILSYRRGAPRRRSRLHLSSRTHLSGLRWGFLAIWRIDSRLIPVSHAIFVMETLGFLLTRSRTSCRFLTVLKMRFLPLLGRDHTVWYELLCGEWPFKNQPPEAVIWQVGKGIKQPLANLQASAEVKDILMLCWQYKEDKRPDFQKLSDILGKLPKKKLERSPSHPVHLSRSAESVF
ncbi:hypothetical protein D910_08359, partial [Dendroctonus ponderosae]